MMQSKKIAITGGIGSGKSLAAGIIASFGYPVFSCDKIYAEICTEKEYLCKLEELFPGSVRDGKLDREYLSALVFSDEKKRRKLDGLSHPRIMQRLFSKMEAHPVAFAEVPLLYETGAERDFDAVLVIARDKSERIQAVMTRDCLSKDAACARLSSQRDWELIPPGAYVIHNTGSVNDFRIKIQKFLENLV